MQIETVLTIAVSIAALSGFTSVASVITATRKWAKAERAKGAEEQRKKDELADYKKETVTSITQFKDYIERKVDNVAETLGGKIDAVKEDVADVKKDIRNGGLKEAIAAMQNACGSRMATVEAELRDHVRLSGHPGVTEKIAALQADVKTLKEKS
jgi:gas vesicle protein